MTKDNSHKKIYFIKHQNFKLLDKVFKYVKDKQFKVYFIFNTQPQHFDPNDTKN